MIELTCTKCKTMLSIDDAFAGGVCRCKHCGTIQTVPRQTKRAAIPASVTANGRPDTVSQATGSGTGLDELAQVVASSGLSGTGLSSSRLRKTPPEGTAAGPSSPPAPSPPIRRETMMILAVGGTIVVLLGIILAILVSGGDPQPSPAKPRPPLAGTAAVEPRAHFLGIPIHSSSVIFILHRGSGTGDVFDMMRVALQNSLATLPPTTQFQIIFWETDSLTAIPESGMQPATPEVVNAAHEALVDTFAFGQSRVEPAMSLALSQNPTDIILATGKAASNPSVAQKTATQAAVMASMPITWTLQLLMRSVIELLRRRV